jgi:hypothetical protein
MPLNNEGPFIPSREDFCLALKAARERSGISLARIAEATKIPAYLFEGLEHNDLHRWPKGLFRRSFFRDYARVIGLPVTEAAAEFVRLFPDDECAGLPNAAPPAKEVTQSNDVRLVLDAGWHGPQASILSRLLAAVLDAGAVSLAAFLAWLVGLDWRAAAAIVALAYFSVATVLLAESPAKWAIERRQMILDALAHGVAMASGAWKRGTDQIKGAGTSDSTPEPIDEPEMPAWISDARRVGPSRLRVRIKVS